MTRWALISDEHSQTRIDCVLDMIRRLQEQGVSIGGFVQRRLEKTDGPGGFELTRLSQGHERVTLAQKPAVGGVAVDDAACDYVFESTAFECALTWIEEDARRCDLVVLDVISKMETYGHGHARSLRRALELAAAKVVLIGARASELNAIVDEFQLDLDAVVSYLELPVSNADRDRFVREVAEACRTKGERRRSSVA